MKFNKLFGLIAVTLCAAFMCAALSGCFISSKANIESVEINVYGFDNSLAEIEVINSEHSLSVSTAIAWQEGNGSGKKLDVTWSFEGDDLGCRVLVIDPGCTKGTIAAVELGNERGRVVLRATAKSKNIISTELVIWIGGKDALPNMFYTLQDAYAKSILKKTDIWDTAHYFRGPDSSSVTYLPTTPKNPEFLSAETENRIKQAFLDDFYFNNADDVFYSINDVSIEDYCGTYNGAVVVYLRGLYGYDQALRTETIEGADFHYRDGNYLRVFVEKEFFAITATAEGKGYISPSGTVKVVKGGSVTFEIYSANSPHSFKAVYVDGKSVDLLLLDYTEGVWSYTFENINSAHAIHAEFSTEEQPDMRSLDGVTMTAEKSVYLLGTMEINVTWKNNTSSTLTFGEAYYLEMKVNEKWQKVPSEDSAFLSIRYVLMPFSETTHIYRLYYIYDNLEAGEYRIVTNFNAGIYWLCAEFTISGNSADIY